MKKRVISLVLSLAMCLSTCATVFADPTVLSTDEKRAYELVHSEGFPTLKIGSRIVVPKDRLREWIDANTTQK